MQTRQGSHKINARTTNNRGSGCIVQMNTAGTKEGCAQGYACSGVKTIFLLVLSELNELKNSKNKLIHENEKKTKQINKTKTLKKSKK